MKKSFILLAAAFAASAFCLTSCDKDNHSSEGLTAYEEEIKAAAEKYVPGVIYETYGKLASAGETLCKDIQTMKEKGVDKIAQSDIDKACKDFLEARAYWEASEAFLFGAATDFSIDPHIDSWPLDRKALANNLSNAKVIKALEEEGVDAISQLGETALGFHGIEFVLFRDGKNRTVSALKGTETASEFAGTGVTGAQELTYAAAVAEDLMRSLYQLNVSWNPNAPKAQKDAVEEAELNCTVNGLGKSYGEDMLGAAAAGSTYASWQLVAKTVLDAGCAGITDEVASTKMGQAHNGEDESYIESPYSKNSFVDFKDNLLSVQYSLYGSYGATSRASDSFLAFLEKNHPGEASAVKTALADALAKIDVCIKSGHFVDDYKASYVGDAIDSIDKLTTALEKASAAIKD
ncbi:MAG: imelysin [Bacteroidales bacterium]|nr:imelysin [Bacteroidales bacterium]